MINRSKISYVVILEQKAASTFPAWQGATKLWQNNFDLLYTLKILLQSK